MVGQQPGHAPGLSPLLYSSFCLLNPTRCCTLRQVFRDNLAKFNVSMGRVRILKGWFNEVRALKNAFLSLNPTSRPGCRIQLSSTQPEPCLWQWS